MLISEPGLFKSQGVALECKDCEVFCRFKHFLTFFKCSQVDSFGTNKEGNKIALFNVGVYEGGVPSLAVCLHA